MMNKQNQSPTVFLVDDEENVRIGLQRFLRSTGYLTETYDSAEAFLQRLPITGVACILLDIQMPGLNGLQLQERLVELGCKIPIVFLTAEGDIPTSVKAIKRGAEDFLSKLSDSKALVEAVEGAISKSRDQQAVLELAAHLTDREREICQHVIAGLLNKQIASKLNIVERTVKAHRAKVMEKFGVDSLPDLVRLVEAAGISPVSKDI